MDGRRATRCQIVQTKSQIVVGEGITLQSKKDNDNKGTARKIALLRAMLKAGWDKQFRSFVVWDAYFAAANTVVFDKKNRQFYGAIQI